MKNVFLILGGVSLNASAQIIMRNAILQIGEINFENKTFYHIAETYRQCVSMGFVFMLWLEHTYLDNCFVKG
jgi:hypothetical protein